MASKTSKSKKVAKKTTKSSKKAVVRAKDVKSAVLKATGNKKNGVIVTSKSKIKKNNSNALIDEQNIIELPKKAKKDITKTKKRKTVVKKEKVNKEVTNLESNNLEVIEKITNTVPSSIVTLETDDAKSENVIVSDDALPKKVIQEDIVESDVDKENQEIAKNEVIDSSTVVLDKKIVDEKKLKRRDLLGKRKIRWDYVIFNAVLILVFAFLILALFRIEVLKGKTILFIGGLVAFLMIIAISYNKYVSGKIFTIILCAAMGFTIYRLQYTYDFIHNLNSSNYEYRTYYVVALDTNINRSIYNINGKRVGMLKDNNTNIRRILNTKLDNVSYVYYEDADKLFEAFYKQDVRAVIVGDNYYKYLLNNESTSNKKVKNLYEFKANAHK